MTAAGYLDNGVNSLMMPSAPSVTPCTMKVLPIPFHNALGPWTAKPSVAMVAKISGFF